MNDIPPPIQAIPTLYQGRLFRSRLEAKWAAWFDLVHWKWDYETLDLEGWAPDFVLMGYRGPIYVEIKPVIPGIQTDQFSKAKRSSVRHSADILLLGMCPINLKNGYTIGVCNEADDGDMWGLALGKHACPGIRIGYCSTDGWWGDRITGEFDRLPGGLVSEDVMRLWGEAGTAVQWTPQ